MREVIRRIMAAEKDGIASMEAELLKAIEEQKTNYEYLAMIMDELMNQIGELWFEKERYAPSKQSTGGYLYLIDRAAEYAKQNLDAESYHLFCEKVGYMLF